MKRSIFGVLLVIGVGCGAKGDPTGPNGAENMIGNGGTIASNAGQTASTSGSGGSTSTETNAGSSGGAGTGSNETAGSGGSTDMTAAGTDGGAGAGGSGAPPGECQGFSFDGIKYSPGGSVLPNTCMPFDPTLNNPYAVRCVDAWPWYKTQFPGDNFCILPPAPDKGVQYGVHPQGKEWFAQVSTGDMSGYEDASIPSGFVLQDGQEEERNYHTAAGTTADQNYYRNSARMRPGSHHMIVSSSDPNDSQETWVAGSPDGLTSGVSLPGAQRPDENAPKSLEKPDEDSGLYAILPGNPGVTFNMHHFNATGGPILKEAWTNLWWEENATTQVHGILGLELTQVFALNVPAGDTQDLHYSWDITSPIRLLTVFGHRHAWTTNFSSWVEKPGGETEIIYQSFDWFDEPTYRYDSMTDNPVPAPAMRTDGAASGVKMLMPGEKFHFNCHIEFTDERAAAVSNAPSPSSLGSLRFANQAFTAEMCILFGSTAAVSLSRPVGDVSALPDFATLD